MNLLLWNVWNSVIIISNNFKIFIAAPAPSGPLFLRQFVQFASFLHSFLIRCVVVAVVHVYTRVFDEHICIAYINSYQLDSSIYPMCMLKWINLPFGCVLNSHMRERGRERDRYR